jgi:hypothetical protein
MSVIFSSKSNDEVIQYLKENSLLKSKFDCLKCGKETKYSKNTKRCRDGY